MNRISKKIHFIPSVRHFLSHITYGLFIVFLTAVFIGWGSLTAHAEQNDISNCTVTLDQASFTYTGNTIHPQITVTDGALVLEEGTDYSLYGASAVTVGEHEITIIGIGDYAGQTTAVFQIQKAANEITAPSQNTYYTFSNPVTETIRCYAKDNAKLSYSTSTSGVAITSDGTLTTKQGFLGTVMVDVRSAETSLYQEARATFPIYFKLEGTYLIEIKDEGILPDSVPDNDHTVKVIWRSADGHVGDLNMQNIDAFEIRHSTDPAFGSKVYKTRVPMLNGFGGLVDTCVMSKNLVKGKKTYFQIRTCKTALDGKTYYSAWSSSLAHKVDSSAANIYKGKKPKNGGSYTVDGIKYVYKNKKLTAVKLQSASTPHQIIIADTITIYGKKYPVTAIKANAFKNANAAGAVEKITIGKNVKTIGKNAFANTPFVKKLTIKSSKLTKKSIGKNAFKNMGKYTGYVKLKAPGAKKASYKKLLKKAGLTRKIK